jgi:N,N'-diacetyllegionaminate synthase
MKIDMGNRLVGTGESTYIVFEAGPTHNGLESAKKLAFLAKESGADAIKFQIADHNRLITTKDLNFSYTRLINKFTGKTELVSEPLIDIWERRYMGYENWKELKIYCDTLDLNFFATTFFEEDVDFLADELKVHSLKIASQDIEFKDLIKYTAAKGLPIQLDTGNASIGKVERAIEWVLEENNNKIIINHCPSGYPARLDSINLNMIKTLKMMFPEYPVAFSDHSPGWEMDIAARSLGADIIEKTITQDRTTASCEHMMSLEEEEMHKCVKALRELDIALGKSRRVMNSNQKHISRNVMRSGFLIKDVKKGEKLSIDQIDFRRPGHGVLRPDSYLHYIGRKFKSNFNIGRNIKIEDLE